MPTISRFYGIIVFMNYNDHDPPHFHARYQDAEVLVEVRTAATRGAMPRRAMQMIMDWREQHQTELLENWELARQHLPLRSIAPLD